MLTLTFTKLFTAGPAKGCTMDEAISVPDERQALIFCNTINHKNRIGQLNYRIIDKTIKGR